MTKQEEIREGIAENAYHFDYRGKEHLKWQVLAGEYKVPYYEFADVVLYKEDSQGVVIKANTKDKSLDELNFSAVEPLIEEG